MLDLRYNGGGLVRPARRSRRMSPASRGSGLAYARLIYNDDTRRRQPDLRLRPARSGAGPDACLRARRTAHLLGERTARQTALRGAGIDVVTIGETSCGKPVGFLPIEHCGPQLQHRQLRKRQPARRRTLLRRLRAQLRGRRELHGRAGQRRRPAGRRGAGACRAGPLPVDGRGGGAHRRRHPRCGSRPRDGGAVRRRCTALPCGGGGFFMRCRHQARARPSARWNRWCRRSADAPLQRHRRSRRLFLRCADEVDEDVAWRIRRGTGVRPARCAAAPPARHRRARPARRQPSRRGRRRRRQRAATIRCASRAHRRSRR